MKRLAILTSLALVFASLLCSCAGTEKPEGTTAGRPEISEVPTDTAAETTAGETTAAPAVQDDSDALAEVLRSGEDLNASARALFTIKIPKSLSEPDVYLNNRQGGCFDGTYYYQAFLVQRGTDEIDNIVRIVKYDVAKKKVVKTSKELSTNHSNDITYIPSTNQLYVVHNKPNRKNVTVIDADTLEFVEVKTLPTDIYCMNYEPAKDLFVIGLSGGQNFRFLRSDLTYANNKQFQATPKTTGYTTQGCATDGNFIYFVLYKENCITVYDWKGKFVTVIHFDVGSIEPENLSVVNGHIYVMCAEDGAKVFEIIPQKAN